jgi:hypothetical protein
MSELTTEQLTQLYQDWSAMGEKREQERIIKLLEHIVEHGTECLMCGNDCSAERLIVLVKGKK